MTDHPIIFSAPMVLALLAGRKTQTRRLLAIRGAKGFSEFGPSTTRGYDWHFRDARKLWHDLRHAELSARLPWQVGDRLYVRENWRVGVGYDGVKPRDLPEPGQTRIRVSYEATDPVPDLMGKLWPPIHMPRWASRLTLTVTDVRVQRLQEISEEDAEAEGAEPLLLPPDGGSYPYIEGFLALWDSIHGKGACLRHPWVVALSFTVAQRNIDAA